MKQIREESMRCFAESVAPKQPDELLSELLVESCDDSDEEVIPKDLSPLLEPYADSGSQGKLIILSLLDHYAYEENYSKDLRLYTS